MSAIPCTPTFYQHTGHALFKEVVKIRHPLTLATVVMQMAPQGFQVHSKSSVNIASYILFHIGFILNSCAV